MEVWVDGQNNFRVEGSPQDLLTVFSAVTNFLRERGRMVVEVRLDGKSISPGDLRGEFGGLPVSEGMRMEIRSEEIQKMVTHCLQQLEEALATLPSACRQLAEVFQGDSPDDGFEPFQHVAEIWMHIKSQESLVANALDLDLEASEVGGASVAALSEELNSFLEEAAAALKTNDAVALGDLLEYELAPRAEQESTIVAWLQERAAALSR